MKNYRLTKVATILAVVVIFTCGYVYGVIHINMTEDAFDEGETPASTSSEQIKNNTPLSEIIIRGAGYFFNAGVDINTLSARYEMAELEGFNYSGLYNAVNDSIYNMEMAAHFYAQLVSKADKTPYKQAVIDNLVAFDYQAFRDQKALNKDIFHQVEVYLIAGDIRGVYKKIQKDAKSILDRLYYIRWQVYWGYLPANESIWDLNQDVIRMHLFGQYVTRVFGEIRE